MANWAILACVDEVLCMCTNNDHPFGGKVFILLGDFQQTCPVIHGGSCSQVIYASIQSSPLWWTFAICQLLTPIWNAQDPVFVNFVDKISNSAGPQVFLSMLQPCGTMQELIWFAFPDKILFSPEMCFGCAILAPTNAQIDTYNSIIMVKIPGPSRTFILSNSLKEMEDADLLDAIPDVMLDWAATHSMLGLPTNKLTLKWGVVARLMQNISIDCALVKNTWMMIVDIGPWIIVVHLLQPSNEPGPFLSYMDPDMKLITHISFHHILHSGHTLIHCQFPLAAAYGTTFNSCQSLTLDKVVLDLSLPVFSHGQLYTALSRICHQNDTIVRIDDSCMILNVTYTELLVWI